MFRAKALCWKLLRSLKTGSQMSPMVGDLLYSLQTDKTFYMSMTTDNGHRRFLALTVCFIATPVVNPFALFNCSTPVEFAKSESILLFHVFLHINHAKLELKENRS